MVTINKLEIIPSKLIVNESTAPASHRSPFILTSSALHTYIQFYFAKYKSNHSIPNETNTQLAIHLIMYDLNGKIKVLKFFTILIIM